MREEVPPQTRSPGWHQRTSRDAEKNRYNQATVCVIEDGSIHCGCDRTQIACPNFKSNPHFLCPDSSTHA